MASRFFDGKSKVPGEDELSNYVSAGYFMTKPVVRPPYVSWVLPREIISLSECICSFLPGAWSVEWVVLSRDDRERAAKEFGVDLPRVIRWATDQFEKQFGWPRVLYSLEIARSVAGTFLQSDQDVALLGLGLHRSHVETFLEHAKPRPTTPGEAPIGETGIYQMVSKGEPPAPGGRILGFELLVYDQDLSCSRLCNGLEQLCMDELNIAPNAGGFLETYEDATQCVEHISSPEVGAEPGSWLPWLIVRYPCDPK